MFCDKCGNQLRDGAKFCDKCSASVSELENHQSNENQNKSQTISQTLKKKKLKNKPLIVIVSAVIILALVTVVILLKYPWPLPFDKAYEKVCDKNIEKIQRITEREGYDKGKNIAVLNIGGSDMPDIIYFNESGNVCTRISLYDEKTGKGYEDFDFDEYSGEDAYDTFFISSYNDGVLWKYTYTDDTRIVHGISVFETDENGKVSCNSLAESVISIDGSAEKYSINGERVTKEEYDSYFQHFYNSKTTIVLSNEKSLSSFTNIIEDISMTYDEAISFLRDRKLPVI